AGGRAEVWHFVPGQAARDRDSVPETRLLLQPERAFQEGAVRARWWDRDRKAFKAEEVLVNARKGVIGWSSARPNATWKSRRCRRRWTDSEASGTRGSSGRRKRWWSGP